MERTEERTEESTEQRLKREAEFQDKKVKERNEKLDQFYTKIYGGVLDALYAGALKEAAAGSGKKVLEIGCGTGHFSLQFARQGATVTAVDISPECIKLLNSYADAEGLTNLTAFVGNAEVLDFPDESFDVVFGCAILHHLDLAGVIPELCRVLKKDGKAVFLEPLGHNPLINLYRVLTPKLRTSDEHPIVMSDFRLFRQHAANVSFRPFYLATLLAFVWRFVIPSEKMFNSSFAFLEKVDRFLFAAIPYIRRHARYSIITFQK